MRLRKTVKTLRVCGNLLYTYWKRWDWPYFPWYEKFHCVVFQFTHKHVDTLEEISHNMKLMTCFSIRVACNDVREPVSLYLCITSLHWKRPCRFYFGPHCPSIPPSLHYTKPMLNLQILKYIIVYKKYLICLWGMFELPFYVANI
jgi:hypothetical protein